MNKNDEASIVRLSLTLLTACFAVAAVLSAVNAVTRDRIAANQQGNTESALETVTGGGSAEFSEPLTLTDAMRLAAEDAGATVKNVYKVETRGSPSGYVVEATAAGSQGEITMVIGVDEEGAVSGVSIMEHNETLGIGSRVMENENGVLDQFQGLTAADCPLEIGVNVEAISGATASSQGVAAGVNGALAVVALLAEKEGGG